MVSPFFSVLESPPVGHMKEMAPWSFALGPGGHILLSWGSFNNYSHGSLSEYRE